MPKPIHYTVDLAARLRLNPAAEPAVLLRELIEEIEDLIADWGEELFDYWPRDTGRSFSMWDSFREGFTIILRNPAEYAGYVHPSGGDEGDAWDHMREYLEAAVARLVQRWRPRLNLAPRPSPVQRRQAPTRRRGLSLFAAAAQALQLVSSRERNRTRSRERLR